MSPVQVVEVAGAKRMSQHVERLARTAVGKAVKDGRLVRPQSCSNCDRPCKPQGHHRDYTKQLEVVWLCVRCHHDEHVAIRRANGFTPKPKYIPRTDAVDVDSIPAELVHAAMSMLGKRGGSKSSKRKTEAARRNARKPRRRLCRGCQGELTSADRAALACTQCGEQLKRSEGRRGNAKRPVITKTIQL
jgi:hypothetical protein